jgi:hypothetical protein
VAEAFFWIFQRPYRGELNTEKAFKIARGLPPQQPVMKYCLGYGRE